MDIIENNKIFTHTQHSNSMEFSAIDTEINQYKSRLDYLIENKEINQEDKAFYLALINNFNEFNLGRFILKNRGLNGFWADYLINYPTIYKKINQDPLGEPINTFESQLLEKLPITVATQQRHEIFKQQAQALLKDNIKILSLPCGLASEILQLDYSKIKNPSLTGIDIDPESLEISENRAESSGLNDYCIWLKQDAWQFKTDNSFDLIISNGLTMYIEDDGLVIDLYRKFYEALNQNGVLITSYITPPPYLDVDSPWILKNIEPQYFNIQQNFFYKIFNAKWHGYRTTKRTKELLVTAGFNEESINIYPDKNNIFPTVTVVK